MHPELAKVFPVLSRVVIHLAPSAHNVGTLTSLHRNSVLSFRTGFVCLRLALEGRPEFDPAVMVFKGACSQLNRFCTLSALKRGL
jgi:hypothetical protein